MQLSELQVTAATHLEEREFYFAKLRDIEVLCQMDEIKNQPVSAVSFPYTPLAALRSVPAGSDQYQQGLLVG